MDRAYNILIKNNGKNLASCMHYCLENEYMLDGLKNIIEMLENYNKRGLINYGKN